MRTRPTRIGSSIRFSSMQWIGAAVAVASLLGVPAASAAGEGSQGERIALTGLDLTIVRPLATIRTGLGAVLLVPASIIASPACFVNLYKGEDCRPVFEAPYDVLVGEPAEYAFHRPMGEL